jgi:hypothetical protein
MPNWFDRYPHDKWRGAPAGVGGIPGTVSPNYQTRQNR